MRSGGGAGSVPEDGGPVMSRRGLLRVGALALAAGPLVAACTGTPPRAAAPDQLLPMLDLATKDATTAKAAAAAYADNGPTLTVIGTARQQHATALRTEVDRAAAVTSTTPTSPSAAPPLPAEVTVISELKADFLTAQQQAAALLPQLPRYRAGLVGSVAAGCASLAEASNGLPITTTSATSASPSASGGSPTLNGSAPGSSSALPSEIPSTSQSAGTLATDTAQALQSALSAENAVLWLYGTASAFVGGAVEPEIIAAMGAVQNLRDATEARLTAGQVAPQPAQPAYLVPKPMTNRTSALVDLALAESAATVAWRSVLEHTDDAGLRSAALAALVDSAVRQTRWRRLSGQSPASVAMPGTPAT